MKKEKQTKKEKFINKCINKFGNKVRRNGGTKISRPLTSLQRKLGVKIIYED